MTQEQPQSLIPIAQAYWTSQVVLVAAQLGLADVLADGSKDVAVLADATRTDRSSLTRLLRALAALGVVTEESKGCFALTDLGGTLRKGVPGSVRDYFLFLVGDWYWQAWGNLMHSVRTGEPSFDEVHGVTNFEYWERNEGIGAIHDAFFRATEAARDAAVLAAYDFSRFHTVVDVGGNRGGLLAAILKKHPRAAGVLFDLPHVVGGAPEVFREAEVDSTRWTAVGGDFFKSVPSGGDAYVLMQVVHDWDDERSLEILTRCREAMTRGVILLLIERVMPEKIEATPAVRAATLTDLMMLVATPGGRERTQEQFGVLLSRAGFALSRVIPTTSPVSLLEAKLA